MTTSITPIIRAVYENSVFRPLEPVDLPKGTDLMSEARIVRVIPDSEMGQIYEILDRRHSSGHTGTAARHNEHQP